MEYKRKRLIRAALQKAEAKSRAIDKIRDEIKEDY